MESSTFPLTPQRAAIVAVDLAADKTDELVSLLGAWEGTADPETLRCALRVVGALVVAQEALAAVDA